MNFGGPPDPDMFEVSLFGTGVGESIAVHIGQGNWLLVDSCRQRRDDFPAHLSYLQEIGVDLSKAVKGSFPDSVKNESMSFLSIV